MSFCVCGHDFTDHHQTDVEYLCLLCSWCDGYTKAAANDSATAPVPAGGTPEGLAREKVEMTDSEVKPDVEQLAEAMWTALSDNGRLWIEADSPKELHKIAASVVAGLEAERRSPIGSNASESPPTEWFTLRQRERVRLALIEVARDVAGKLNDSAILPTESGMTVVGTESPSNERDASESPPTDQFSAEVREYWRTHPDPSEPITNPLAKGIRDIRRAIRETPRRDASESGPTPHTQDCIDAFYSDGGQSGCICGADR